MNLEELKKRFPIGAQVKPSKEGLANCVFSRPNSKMIIKGYSRDGRCIRVAIEGFTSIVSFHPDFLEVVGVGR